MARRLLRSDLRATRRQLITAAQTPSHHCLILKEDVNLKIILSQYLYTALIIIKVPSHYDIKHQILETPVTIVFTMVQ